MKEIVRSHALSKTQSAYSFCLCQMQIEDEKLQVWYFTIDKELIIRRGDNWMIENDGIPDQIYDDK